ncbi:glycosyl hydrolase family 95 catalytic domain-containing protein [Paenibacillus periandrae]|uniref:glycoside hydrolase family 95 protein n=1 Tax=Paenibacillus periandrae TaxID=1761741 RepID=UPI001F09E1FD|nr:glycoside hydrolase family 95 protein [Paenibacillus periandrae]
MEVSGHTGSQLKLWYDKAAKTWTEALPIGNGRLGGMIFGTTANEKIQLNEDTIWYGGPKDADNPDAQAYLPEIRKMLMDGRQQEAEHLSRMALMSGPKYYHPYVPAGDLCLWFLDHNRPVEGYIRELNLETAIAQVSYRMDGAHYRREYFSSAADQVIVVRLESELPRGLTFSANLMRRPYDAGSRAIGDDTVVMQGECGKDGIAFSCVVKAIPEGGTVQTIGDFVSIEQADAVTLLIAVESTFRSANPEEICLQRLDAAAIKGYEELKRGHIAEYADKFNRVSIRLTGEELDTEQAQTLLLSTDRRLERVQKGGTDQGLIEIFFQYGRYLLVSCSRPDSLAANLQGIWNDSYSPPWESKYTININTEMNYWPAEVCGLPECHQPLFDLIERMRPNGRKTAKELYRSRGFVAHHNTNLWGETRLEGILVSSSIWPLGAAWLSLHLWEHYRYGLDEAFLAEQAYPVMKEAAEFLLDYMVEDAQGRLITGPSISPENKFILPSGVQGNLCMGPAMDMQLVYTLFTACMEAGKVTGDSDAVFRLQLEAAIGKLPRPQIGKYGQIMEWLEDYDEAEPGHRHISQLFALHPGEMIDKHRTPELAEGARRTLERRLASGGGHTGWSRAWIINFYARLGDGDSAFEHISKLLATSTYPNLFDCHPPFQIDGNFGGTAGIAELLLQSHGNVLELLPALPAAWPEGEITGLRARGAFGIDIRWQEGQVQHAVIRAGRSGSCRIRMKQPSLICHEDGTDVAYVLVDGIAEFACEAGSVYCVLPM